MSATVAPTPPAEGNHRLRLRPGPDAASSGFVVLRIGLGVIWTLNLMFILDPANDFFSGFAATARSFGPTSLGGPGLAQFVASNSGLFSAVIALTTAYLAIAFLIGATSRMACLVGFVFNSVLFATQFGSTVVVPGGTDVGPMPLYLLIYLILAAFGTPTMYSVDAWWSARVRGVPPGLAATPAGGTI